MTGEGVLLPRTEEMAALHARTMRAFPLWAAVYGRGTPSSGPSDHLLPLEAGEEDPGLACDRPADGLEGIGHALGEGEFEAVGQAGARRWTTIGRRTNGELP